MNQAVKIDREGLQDIRTGERHTMILAEELEVSAGYLVWDQGYFILGGKENIYFSLISWVFRGVCSWKRKHLFSKIHLL